MPAVSVTRDVRRCPLASRFSPVCPRHRSAPSRGAIGVRDEMLERMPGLLSRRTRCVCGLSTPNGDSLSLTPTCDSLSHTRSLSLVFDALLPPLCPLSGDLDSDLPLSCDTRTPPLSSHPPLPPSSTLFHPPTHPSPPSPDFCVKDAPVLLETRFDARAAEDAPRISHPPRGPHR